MAKKASSSSSVLQQPLPANNLSSASTSTIAQVQEMKEFPSLEGRPLPTVHVNNASLGEIKLALDEAVKKVRYHIHILCAFMHQNIILTSTSFTIYLLLALYLNIWPHRSYPRNTSSHNRTRIPTPD